jgi:aryl-alcohol dehydrogenase-like predicted oxidoreductase
VRERFLGGTGIPVSSLGLGLAALGRPGYINLGHASDLAGSTSAEALEGRTHEVLDAARAAGIRYFDVARSYGRGEEFLGGWLRARGIAPGTVTVGSKWGYEYTADWRVDAPVHEEKEHSAARLERQLDESRSLLGAHLRLYQIHSATEESGVLERAAVLERLARARDEGLAIGLSVTGPRQADVIRQALAIEIGGRPLFASVQATWNLLEPSAGPALAEARRAGIGVIVKEPLANGRLTARNRDARFAKSRAILERAAGTRGATLDALALAAALSRPFADVVLSGAATVDQLRSNLGALELDLEADVEHLVAAVSEPVETYWHERTRLPWT